MGYIKNVYIGDALQTKEKLFCDIGVIDIYQIYKNYNKWFYFCENSKGYVHIYIPQKIKYLNDTFYCITHYILTKDNTLKELSQSSYYPDLKRCIATFEEKNNIKVV